MQWHSNFWQYFSWDIISQTSNPFERAQKVSNSEDHFQEKKLSMPQTMRLVIIVLQLVIIIVMLQLKIIAADFHWAFIKCQAKPFPVLWVWYNYCHYFTVKK